MQIKIKIGYKAAAFVSVSADVLSLSFYGSRLQSALLLPLLSASPIAFATAAGGLIR